MKNNNYIAVVRDRNDVISETKIAIDPRWESIEVDYISSMKEDGETNVSPFLDDHYRGINNNFKKSRGRNAGRDDRTFVFTRSEEDENRLKELRSTSDALHEKAQKMFRDAEVVDPKYIHTSISSEDFYAKYESPDTRSTRTEHTHTVYTVEWIANDKKTNYGNVRGTFLGSKEARSREEATRLKDGPVPQEVLDAQSELQEKYDQFIESSEMSEIMKQIEETKQEISEFKSPGLLEVTIDLYPPGSDRNAELQKILGSEKMRFFENVVPSIPQEAQLEVDQEKKQNEGDQAEIKKEGGESKNAVSMSDLMSKFGRK